MRIIIPFAILFLGITSCSSQSENSEGTAQEDSKSSLTVEISEVDQYYLDHHQDSLRTKSIGTVSKGRLENATLIPFSGSNYRYFDTSSYLGGRAFTHQTVAQIILNTFEQIENKGETRMFRVMEFSNEHGGKMFPHRTHQNGMSVDLMMPLIKDGNPCYELDDLGAMHYLLEFNKNGQYISDPSISIDFEQVASEIIAMEAEARKLGMRIKKVIFNTDLRDELFNSPSGKILSKSGPYITRNLEPVINDLHDDHFHVDFEFIN